MTNLRIGHGYDVHRLTERRRLVLGGVEIPWDCGLLGHSDADVLTHAVMDALCGAAKLGDIGKLFPDSDPRYAGISSLELLRQVAALLQERGWAVVNIDATLIAQAPKVGPYRPEMEANLSAALGTDADRVNVKATTEEHLGFTGDGSGKPLGILAASGGAETGITAASATAITADELIDLFYSLKSPYRRNAVWVLNDSTIKAVRKLKDGSGQYLWQPSLTAGTPDTILGRPVRTSAYMPAIAASAKTIAFGDFSYYWIADRQGRSFKRLNELYAANGQVGFLASQRVDGKIILPEAVKVLVQKAS